MAGNLYKSITGAGNAAQPQMNWQQMMQQLRQNPAQMMKQAGYNVPDGMNNPQQIVQHLMQSGQLSTGRLSQLQQMAKMFGRR